MSKSGVGSEARAILDLSQADPERCLVEGAKYLRQLEIAGPSTAVTLRAMSDASNILGKTDDALAFAEEAIEVAGKLGDTEELVMASLAKTRPFIVWGRLQEALEAIDSVDQQADSPRLNANCEFQRAVVLARMGDIAGAIDTMERALEFARSDSDQAMLMRVLRGLGWWRIGIGDLTHAARDLDEALAMAIDRHEKPAISGIRHNLGLLASYRGDLPEALRQLTISDEIYMDVTGSPVPQHVARCELLLSAGLFAEARVLARQIVDANRAASDFEHLGRSLVVAARASLADEAPDSAANLAGEAYELLSGENKQVEALRARAIEQEAVLEGSGANEQLLRQTKETAAGLARTDPFAAANAHLLVGRIALELGDSSTARSYLSRVERLDAGPVELRIQSRVAGAQLALLNGDGRAADAAARAGLRMIDEYQAVIGATDMRVGIERHGKELTEIGLDLAVRSRRARRVLAWLERSRGRALRYRPSAILQDDSTQELFAQLRRIESDLRVSARTDRSLQAKRRRVQDQIANAARVERGSHPTMADVGIDDLIERLGRTTLLELGYHKGTLIGVVPRDGVARSVTLGDESEIRSEVGHLRFAMRRAARMGRRLDATAFDRLGGLLLDQLPSVGEEVVVVPPPDLMAVPWSVLPGFRDHVVTVAPSAEMWVRRFSAVTGDGAPLIVAGPDLEMATTEVAAISDLYPSPTTMTQSAVDEVLEAMDGAGIAHIVSHAQFNAQSPMFSSLRMGDGDINVYDIERLAVPPRTVVLSACDSGYSEARAGAELTGLTSALLAMGSRSVIASIGLVPDAEATADLMVRFHSNLLAGSNPARALSQAQQAVVDDPVGFLAAASFICVGG